MTSMSIHELDERGLETVIMVRFYCVFTTFLLQCAECHFP